jgi:phosphotransacetylase/acyl dehydratase
MNAIEATAATLAASSADCMIENRTYAEIAIGDTASITRQATRRDIDLLAIVSGHVNPLHSDPGAAHSPFHKAAAQGLFGSALIYGLIGSKLPGPGAICVRQDVSYLLPVSVGDTLTVTVTVREKHEAHHELHMDCLGVNQNGELALTGTAHVRAPLAKLRVRRPELPGVQVSDHQRFYALITRAQGEKPVPMAVAHPCDVAAVSATVESARAGLIDPILIGPRAKILAAGEKAGVDLTPFRLIDAPHSVAAAASAVELSRRGEVGALMKGSLPADELLEAVIAKQTGLGAGRRLSHVYLVDAPGYPRPLLLTDAGVNIAPDLETKRDIIQNAVDLAKILGVEQPRVAVLAAVETINLKMPATLDAAALCKMADRGQIRGALVDGPLAFDNAISPAAAREKELVSPVAGQADILVVPDLEAGNMLAKQLTFLAGADAAGVVLGAKVPIVFTSRTDSARTRLASCAVAGIIARAQGNAG